MGFSQQLGESTGPELDAGSLRGQLPGESPHLTNLAQLSDASQATASLAIPQLEDWLGQLLQGDFQTRWEISKTLKQHPIGVLGPLLCLLPQAQEDEELLWFIARLLGEIDHPEAVDSLVNILQSATTTEMQSVAALALANRGRSALPALAQLLLQPDTCLLVVQVLSQIDAPEVVDLLLGVAVDDDAAVRCAAIDALGGFADPRIAPVLLKALQDHDSGVRRLAVRAVGARKAHLPGVALDEAIAPLLHDLNAKVVEQAIVALGRLDTSLAREGLAQVIAGDHWQLSLQLQAVRALGWSHATDAVKQLLTQLDVSIESASQGETGPLSLAREIVVVLGRLRAPQKLILAAQELEARLPALFVQGDADLKRSAALALGQLGQQSSFDALCTYLLDSSPGLTFHIMAALRRLDPGGGLARLQRFADVMPASAAEEMKVAIAEWS